MALDLGAVVGRVILEDVEFQRSYVRIVRQFSELGGSAEKSAAGTTTLDEALAAVAKSANTASTSVSRSTKATGEESVAAKRAAVVEEQRAAAIARVAAVMKPLADATAREQVATLRDVAAQERLTAVRQGAATEAGRQAAATARVASAQAGAIASTERLAAAQTTGAESAGFFAGRLGGMVKMAGQLGLLIGAVGAIKMGLDVTREANDYHRAMVQVQTTTNTTAAEVNMASGALLKMAGPVAAAPRDLATAWYHAKSVGLDYAKSIDTTRIAAEGARVGHADLEQTMNALTSTVASGIPGVKNMSGAMGQLIAIVGAGDMKLSDLNSALSSGILTIVKGYGLSLTDVGAALATFGDNNIRGAEAATMLRMAVQAMAVPAKAGRDELTKLGLSATQLATDMQTGGLNKAILDLKAHLDSAGVSSVQVGAVLTEVFGKRAGPGIAVLVGQVDRLESKFKVLRDASSTFDAKWQATTQTASFALARVEHQVEAAGIAFTAKLGPSIAAAANWLGVSLPHAIGVLAQILGPTVHMVGVALVGAFVAAHAILAPVVGALGSLGHVLAENNGVVRDATGLVLGLWLAFKGYRGAVIAIEAVRTAMLAFQGSVVVGNASAAAFGTNLRALATGGGAGAAALLAFAVAVGIGGAKLNGFIEGGRSSVAVINSLGGAYKDWKAALDATNGALTENVLKSIAAQLQADGLAGKAHAAGISLNDLTVGLTGSAAGFDDLIAKWKAGGKPSDDTIQALRIMRATFGGAITGAKELGTVTGKLSTAQRDQATAARGVAGALKAQSSALHLVVGTNGNLVWTTAKVATAADAATKALQAQTQASTALKTAEDLLNGVNESVETSTDNLSIALGNLRSGQSLATGANGKASRSLDQNTVAGATNRQMLVGLIDAAKAQAQATADQAAKHTTLGRALEIGNGQLKKNEDAIRSAAKSAGLSTQATNDLIASLGILSKVDAKPKVDAITAPANNKIVATGRALYALNQQTARPAVGIRDNASPALGHIADYLNFLSGRTVTVTVNEQTRQNLGSTIRSQTHADGGTVTGTGGPKQDNVVARLSVGEEVIQNPYAEMWRPLLKQINSGQYRGQAMGGGLSGGMGSVVARASRSIGAPAAASVAPLRHYASAPAASSSTVSTSADRLVPVVASLVGAVSDLVSHPAQIVMDGKVVGEAVFHSSAVIRFVDEIVHRLEYQ